VSRLRRTLVALLVASTALFAVGVIAERSHTDTHVESVSAQAETTGGAAGAPEGVHEESGEPGAGEEGRAESATHANGGETVLGVDVEYTPLAVLAVLAGLALAALAATRFGRLRGFLYAVAVIALAWAALDGREVIHQIDESRTGVAVVAVVVAVLHLAVAAVGGRLARQPPVVP
jgi:hypothetical protein